MFKKVGSLFLGILWCAFAHAQVQVIEQKFTVAQDGSGNFVSTSLTTAQNFEPSGPTFTYHTLDVFMYDSVAGGATKAYQGPDSISRLLDPNSFSIFIDNLFIIE